MTRTSHHHRVQKCLETLESLSTVSRGSFLQRLDLDNPTTAREARALWPHYGGRADFLESLKGQAEHRAREHRVRTGGEQTPPFCIDQYRITKRMGTGGMGIVYQAERATLDTLFALKLLRHDRLSPAYRRRFAYEVEVHRRLLRPGHRGVARFVHDGVAGVNHSNTIGTAVHGRPYFVMESVGGDPITLHAAKNRLGLLARLELFVKVCDAVTYIHSQGVIHRDLKPGNVLIDSHGQPKIIDFGIARLGARQFNYLPPETGSLIGTAQYASPEQLVGRIDELTPESDVYSLGLVCMELVTGKVPVRDGPYTPPRLRHVCCEPQECRPDVRELFWHGLELAISRAVQPAIAKRYASAAMLGADIQTMIDLLRGSRTTWFQRLAKPAGGREKAPDATHAALVAIRRLRAEQAVVVKLREDRVSHVRGCP